ncbi:MAG: NHL repeat-containing protein, partial [Terracidiphilus sp.]
MFSKPLMSLRRFSGPTLTVLFLSACMYAGAQAQTAPAAIASFATGVNHINAAAPTKTIGPLGAIANIATDSAGDVLAVDAANGALYEFPAGGGDAIVLVPAGGLAGTAVNSLVAPGIAIDKANNLYIEEGSCILMYPSPWSGLSTLGPSSCGTTGAAPTFYNFGSGSQPWGLAIAGSSSQALLVGVSPNGATAGGSIVSIPLTGAPTPSTIISGMAGAPISVAADPSGNIYFVENGSSALAGAYEVPSGQTPTSDSGLTKISSSTLTQVTGVAADSQGNVYISDGLAGVFLYPHGATSSSAAFLVTALPAQGEVAFVGHSGLFVPTTTPPQPNLPADIAQISFSTAQFGPLAVNAKKPAQANITFSFDASTTPATIQVIEAGKSTPDFSVVSGGSGTCLSPQLQAPYGPGSGNSAASCPVTVSFAPQSAGNVSATLVMLDAKNNLLASIPLNGTGMSAAVQVTSTVPSTPVTIGGSLVTPSQIAVDAAGNLYVADSGKKAVEMYPSGSGSGTAGTSVGTGLLAPTGVAVDGAGDVFIADSGNVYEIPESSTAAGLNAKGQITLQSGLGSQVQLAADGIGDLYVSDISNQKVYELQNFSTGWNASLPGVLASQTITLTGTAFSAPSAIAVDPYNNLFVLDGGTVYEVTPAGTQTQVLTGLNGALGLAIDPSGSLYGVHVGGAVRIPNQAGTLNKSDATVV